MGLYYTSFKKKKRNKLPLTPELLEARKNHRKYLISLGVDPDRKINKKVKENALHTILSRKLKDGEILFVDSLSFPVAKANDEK